MYYQAIDENGQTIASGWQQEIHDIEQKILSHLADKQLTTATLMRSKRPNDESKEFVATYALAIDDDNLYLERSKR